MTMEEVLTIILLFTTGRSACGDDTGLGRHHGFLRPVYFPLWLPVPGGVRLATGICSTAAVLQQWGHYVVAAQGDTLRRLRQTAVCS